MNSCTDAEILEAFSRNGDDEASASAIRERVRRVYGLEYAAYAGKTVSDGVTLGFRHRVLLW